MNALWQLLGTLLTAVVIIVISALAITEGLGGFFHQFGFITISDAARQDLRIAIAVELLFLIAAIWWPLHVWVRL